MSYRVLEALRREAWERFAAMPMFFVKVCADARSCRLGPFLRRTVTDSTDPPGLRLDVYCTNHTTPPLSRARNYVS